MFKVKLGKDEVTPWLRRVTAEAKNPRAIQAGINRTMQSAYTASVRAIQQDIAASSQKTIKRNLSLRTATAAQPGAELVARSAKKERVPLYEMKPRPKNITRRRPAGGVSYGPESKLIPGSFIAKFKSGHVGVFKRIGARRIADARRYLRVQAGVLQRTSRALNAQQITELFGPSVALVFGRKKILDPIKELIDDKLPKEIERALKFVKGK